MQYTTDLLLEPFAWYTEMRTTTPVWYNEDLREWTVFRFADAQRVASDHRVFSSRTPEALGLPLFTQSLNFTDPPQHSRLRGLVQQEFAPRRIEQLAERVQAIVDGLIDDILARGEPRFDLVANLSGPLPAIVIAELLGVPAQDQADFRRWADLIVLAAEPGRQEEGFAGMTHMAAYYEEFIEVKRQSPQDDLMTALVQAHDAGQLTHAELIDFGIVLLTGGHETTTNFIGNTIRCLDAQPAARTALDASPALLPMLLEEVLRFRSPVHALNRITTAEVTLSDVTIPLGQLVNYCIGAANRDPAKFSEAERFIADRDPKGHLAFGFGIHGCIGAALARLETRICIETLLRRMPQIRIDPSSTPVPVPTISLHGVKELYVLA